MVKILIVDDSQELLDLFTHLLSMKGYIVATATSKITVFNKVSNFNPDLILMDVRLDGADGRELSKEIKQNNSTKEIPVILLSASPELLIDYKECKAVDMIEKPFELATVIQKIERALTVATFLNHMV